MSKKGHKHLMVCIHFPFVSVFLSLKTCYYHYYLNLDVVFTYLQLCKQVCFAMMEHPMETTMGTPWEPHGNPMGTQWENPWGPHGDPMGTPWTPHGEPHGNP